MKKLAFIGALLLLQTTGFAQLQNTNFENWENPINNSISSNRPINWIRTNGIEGSELIPFYHPPTTEAQDGNYALRLSVWYTYDLDMAVQIAPINYRPTSLTGFYSYTETEVIDDISNSVIEDVARVTVRLTKLNPVTGEADLIGIGINPLLTSETYSPFTCLIDYTSDEIPDTIEVIFDCSVMDKVAGYSILPLDPSGISSILTVDNITLNTETLSTKNNSLNNINIYPNPTTNIINFPDFEGNIKIYDLTGKLIKSTNSDSGNIDISSVANGVYILSLTNEFGSFNAKIVKQ